MNFCHHIWSATKFKVHLQNFSKISARAGFGGTIYLGITKGAYHIFCGMFPLLKGLFNHFQPCFAEERKAWNNFNCEKEFIGGNLLIILI